MARHIYKHYVSKDTANTVLTVPAFGKDEITGLYTQLFALDYKYENTFKKLCYKLGLRIEKIADSMEQHNAYKERGEALYKMSIDSSDRDNFLKFWNIYLA